MAALSSDNELLHGEAVNIDMALTTEVSRVTAATSHNGLHMPACPFAGASRVTPTCVDDSELWFVPVQISCNRGLISPAQRDRVYSVMRALQLPMHHDVCSTKLYMKVRSNTPL